MLQSFLVNPKLFCCLPWSICVIFQSTIRDPITVHPGSPRAMFQSTLALNPVQLHVMLLSALVNFFLCYSPNLSTPNYICSCPPNLVNSTMCNSPPWSLHTVYPSQPHVMLWSILVNFMLWYSPLWVKVNSILHITIHPSNFVLFCSHSC